MKLLLRLSEIAEHDLKPFLVNVTQRLSTRAGRFPFLFIALSVSVGLILGLLIPHHLSTRLITTMQATGIAAALKTVMSFIDRRISIGFLTDVAAFETAIIAFLIPLSLEMIAKISERYQSEVVLLPFHREWENRVLLKLLIVNVLLAITLRFLLPSDEIIGWWRAIVWLIMAIFLITTVTVYRFMRKLRRYMTDTSFLIDKLFTDARASIND